MVKERLLSALCLCAALSAFGYETALYESVDLCGAWEMSYDAKLPAHAVPVADEAVPKFSGERVERAIPAYWEDLPQFAQHALKFAPEAFPMRKRIHTLIPGQIRGTFFYRRTVELKETGPNAFLSFELVRNNVRAWVNGTFVGRHCGFLTPFEVAVPDGVLVKGANEIVLAVDNGPVPGIPPKYNCGGGTTSRAIFQNTGGIDGRCELRFAKSALKDVYVTTAEDLRTFTVHVAGGADFAWRILDGTRAVRSGRANGDFAVPTEGFAFWSPERPKRYELELKTPGGTFRTKFGIRRLVARGERLFLNGEPVYLRGVCDHCYYAKTMHLPLDVHYYRMVVRNRKACGFNFVRFHTYVPPEAFFEAMDELGYLVHVETPHTPSAETFAEVVAFARRHPCAVIYCAGNEDTMKPALEAALEDYAGSVHAMSDGLFSPISALKNAEYAFGKDDVVVKEPFPHNPSRLAHYATFSDLFTSFQLGYVSYSSLTAGSPEMLDRMGDAYCGKPRLSHEICIDGSYVDLSTERLYPADSPFLKTGIFDGIRRQLVRKGLMDRADTYYRNSCEWMWRIRKHAFEKLRASKRTQGFDFLGDINTHWHTCGYSVGLFDEFYRMKPGESFENVLRYNAAAVLLCDLGADFVFSAGATKRVGFKVSNYDVSAKGGTFRLTLETPDGKVVLSSERQVGALPKGEVKDLPGWDVVFPAETKPRKYWLKASLAAGELRAENRWEAYAFPKPATVDVSSVRVMKRRTTKAELLTALAAGERVALLGEGPFNALPVNSFRIGLAGRSSGNYATVVKDHPALGDFPHEGYCGWQFRRLFEGASAIQLEGDVPFDPIVDIASSVKVVIRQALLAEYRVGKGRLLVSGFKFHDDDSAGAYLKSQLLAYAASDRFEPQQAITPEQLASVIDAPIVTGSVDTNRANDTNAN